MKIIDFRFRPNTPEIINGIKNSSMFKATCEAIGFDKTRPPGSARNRGRPGSPWR